MKRFTHIVSAVSLLIFATGCVKEQTTTPTVCPSQTCTFNAVQADSDPAVEERTRTVIENETAVYWSPNDSIKVFYGSLSSGKFVSDSKTAAASTTFSGTFDKLDASINVGREASDFWGVYPYTSTSSCSGSDVTISLPAIQTAMEGTFAPDLFPSVAKSSNLCLAFYNVCGGIMFTVSQSGIQSVTFKGNNNENIAGVARVGMDADGRPVVNSFVSGSKSITVTAPEGDSFKPGVKYYIVTYPINLTNGFSLTFDKMLTVGTYSASTSVSIKRSVFTKLEDKDDGQIFTTKDDIPISAIITDGETLYREADGDKIYMIDTDGFNDMVATVNRVNENKGFAAFSGSMSADWAGGWIYLSDDAYIYKWNFYHNDGSGYHRFSSVGGTTGKFILSIESGTPKVNGNTTWNVFTKWTPGDGTLAIFGWYNTYDKKNPYWQYEGDAGNKIYSFTIDGIEFTPVLHWNTIEHKYYPTWRYTYNDETHYMRLIQGNPSYDMVDHEALELSKDGTANCYIVPKAGTYKFNATVKGNSTESVGTPASAEVLWETFGTDVKPNVGDVIASANYEDGYIFFTTPATLKNGNALVAVKDASGTILWSWHIWVCKNFDPVTTQQVYANNAGTMMDRNLGATSATPGDAHALGLLYQWGRKDPFLGAGTIENDTEALSTSKMTFKESGAAMSYAIQNPKTYIGCSAYAQYDWCTDLSTNKRWNKDKGQHDPCPTGWKVADENVWYDAFGSTSTLASLYLDYDNYGNLLPAKICGKTAWYPFTGLRGCWNFNYSPSGGGIWTSSTRSDRNLDGISFGLKDNPNDNLLKFRK